MIPVAANATDAAASAAAKTANAFQWRDRIKPKFPLPHRSYYSEVTTHVQCRHAADTELLSK